MSVVTASTIKGEKSKKFQSLDINNIYQGSATKPQQKSIPQKPGLHSLGKIPTARRAPKNLPSLKAENDENGPTIAIVPAGSSGWAGKDEISTIEKANAPSSNGQAKLDHGNGIEQSQHLTNSFHPKLNNIPQQQAQPVTGDPTQPKTWRNVTQTGTRAAHVAAAHARQNLLNHKSPLFGQEFPSLSSSVQTVAGTNEQEGKSSNSSTSGSKHENSPILDVTASQKIKGQTSPLIGSNDAQKYGPGPNLRPQFGNWSFGGGSKINEQSSNAQQQPSQGNQTTSDGSVNFNGPPVPSGLISTHANDPAAAIAVNRVQPIQRDITSNQFKFDVSPKSPLIPQHTALIRKSITSESGLKKLTPQLQSNNRSGGRYVNSGKNDYRSNKVDNAVFQQSIIDNEKLKRMDDFDRELNDDDWARSDETFDYNKKIASDDEDENEKRTHPDWADQIKPSSKPVDKRIALHESTSSTTNSYEQPYNHSQSHRPRPLSSEVSFLDEEEQRRSKKNEEVLKNIERAKRRREEEEQKYNKNSQQYEFSQPLFNRNLSEDNRGGRDNYQNRNQPSRPQLNDERNGVNNRRSPGSYRGSHNTNERNSRDDNDNRTNSNTAKSTFGKFDVIGGPPLPQPYNDHDKQASNDSYEAKQLPNNERKQIQILQPPHHSQYDNGGGSYVPRKQMQQQSSVPPRFKRFGGELHAYKRSSPPKETISSAPNSADVDFIDNDGDKEASPSSVRSQSSKEKEFGSFFRSSSGTSGNRKSPGNADRHSNHSNAGSTVGCGTDKEDTDRNSTSSKDEFRKDNILQLSGNIANAGRTMVGEQGPESASLAMSHGEKDNGYDSSEISNVRLSQDRSSADRMLISSQTDLPRPPHKNISNTDQYDESRSQRDSRVRANEENYHSYEDGRMEQPYHMTKGPVTSNATDRRDHIHQQHLTNQGRFDNRYDTDNRDRRDRNTNMGKTQNDDFKDMRDRDYDRGDRNRDKVDREIRSSRGGRSNRGIYGSRSESNVPGSLTKSLQTNTASSGPQKKIILPMKVSQGRNVKLTDEDTQESTFLKPKHASGDLENSNITKDIESKMKNLNTSQMDVILVPQQPQTTNVAHISVPLDQNTIELLVTENLPSSESTLETKESFQPIAELSLGEGAASSSLLDHQNSSGWFAARGQPSRRGRGGLANVAGPTRSFTRTEQDTDIGGGFTDSTSVTNITNKQGRASLPRTGEEEWDSASDKSFEENAKRVQLQQPLDEKYYDRSKPPQREKGVSRDVRKPERDDRYRKQENVPEGHFSEGGAYADNRRRNDRDESRRGKYEVRGGIDRAGDKRGMIVDRNIAKQPNYDTRRQKQLPPRLAKQKEASRVMGGLPNVQSDGSGWGPEPVDTSSYQTWDQNVVHQQAQMSQAAQQQNQRGSQMMAGDYVDHTSMMQQSRYPDPGTASIQASGDIIHSNATGGESQHGHSSAPPVQTIIFENTNLKGGRGNPIGISNAIPSGTTSVNEKLIFNSSVHSSSGGVGDLKPDAIQMPPIGGFVTNKNEDSDLKLDFTFVADISHNVDVGKDVDNKQGNMVGTGNASRSTSGHHPTEDLSAKIANVKKVWEMPSMSPVPHSDVGPNNATFNQGFATGTLGSNDDKSYRQPGSVNDVGLDADNTIQGVSSTGNGTRGGSTNAYGSLSEKTEGMTPNVAKVRPQQMQQHHQQHMSHPSQGHQHQAASMMQAHQAHANQQALQDRVAAITRSTAAAVVGPNNGGNANGTAGNRFTGAAGLTIGSGSLPALQSPQLMNQAPSLYQAFQLDHAGRGGMATNPLYSAYAGLGGQSVLLSSSGLSPGNGNMFGASAAGSQFRLQDASNANQFAGPTQQSSGNAVLLSQSNLMSSAMKQSNQIGPIGTKGGNGPFQQSGIGTLPASGTSPLHLIQSDGQGYINYMTPNAMQRSTAGQGPDQTAFYQALAASTQQQQQQQQVVSRQQGVTQQTAGIFSNVQGYGNQQGLTQQQQMAQAAQLRNQAAAAVAAAAGAPHPSVSGIPYSREQQAAAVAAAMKQQAHGGITRTESFASVHTNSSTAHGNISMTGQTNLGQYQGHPFQQQQMQPKVSMNTVQMSNMSSLVNATGSHSNRPSGPTYSPTPIQRPHMGQGKPMNDEESMVENGSMKDKKCNEET